MFYSYNHLHKRNYFNQFLPEQEKSSRVYKILPYLPQGYYLKLENTSESEKYKYFYHHFIHRHLTDGSVMNMYVTSGKWQKITQKSQILLILFDHFKKS